MATRLKNLEIDEVSGVASPANELPSFMVIKSEEGTPTLTQKDVDRMESDYAILYSALKACEQYMAGDGTPPEVVAAKDTLIAHIEGMFSDATPEENAAPPAEAPAPVAASADKEPQGLLQRLFNRSSLGSGESETPTETTKEKDVPETPETPATAEETPAEKSTAPDIAAELVTALKAVGEQLQALTEGQETMREVQSVTLDRLGAVEAQRQGIDVDDLVAAPATKSTGEEPKGQAALRSALSAIAKSPGRSVTLGG